MCLNLNSAKVTFFSFYLLDNSHPLKPIYLSDNSHPVFLFFKIYIYIYRRSGEPKAEKFNFNLCHPIIKTAQI